MKRISLIFLTVSLIIGLANCKKQSDNDFIKDFAQNLCYKIADCATESLNEMPEMQKKRMASYMPSHEKCDEQVDKEFSKEENKFVLSSEEKTLGQECMADVKKTACSQMQKTLPSCKKFNSLLVSKKGKS